METFYKNIKKSDQLDLNRNKKVAIIGGTSGLGLALANRFLTGYDCEKILVTGRSEPRIELSDPRFEYKKQDLNLNQDWAFIQSYDAVVYAAGIGKIGHFNEFTDDNVISTTQVNAIAPILMINSLSNKLKSTQNFRLAVVTSISSRLISPLFSIYGATKSCISSYIQSVNVEIEECGSNNIITEIAPGFIDGTGFYQKPTELTLLDEIASRIAISIFERDKLIIPKNSELYQGIIKECNADPVNFGRESYHYKAKQLKERK